VCVFLGNKQDTATGCEPERTVQGVEVADPGDEGNGGWIEWLRYVSGSAEINCAAGLVRGRMCVFTTCERNLMLYDAGTRDDDRSHQWRSDGRLVFLASLMSAFDFPKHNACPMPVLRVIFRQDIFIS
jgi:hypothetical protein